MARPAQAVTISTEGGLATIRMAREHGNAINAGLVRDLAAAFRQAHADPAVRGVLLASAGKIFCPGLDLQELIDYDRPAMERFMAGFNACLFSLYNFPKPLVAAVAGHALAGGCILVLTADHRVLRRGAIVGLNEVRVGVPLPFGVAAILCASVAVSRREEVALVGRNYTDDEAVATGLVHELWEVTGFEEHCTARLEELASKDPGAFAATKRYLRSGTVERILTHDAAHLPEFLDCWFSKGTRGRIRGIVAELRGR